MKQVRFAPVALVETDVFGAVAHHARCLVFECGWESKRYDMVKGFPNPAVVRVAKDHGRAHVQDGDPVVVGTAVEAAYGR